MNALTEAKSEQRQSPVVLSVRDLVYRFDPGTLLFEGLGFDIQEGEFVSFLAPSGVGKTTLFRLIAGLLAPESGSITLSGGQGQAELERRGGRSPLPSESGGPAASDSRRIGYMPQRDCLMPWRTVWENAALGLEIAGVTKREAKKRVLELLPAFGLEGAENRLPAELSGGMRQRVSFLRTLLSGGRLLLLDEPFSALDAMTRLAMQEWLLGMWERYKSTILFITHDVEEALLLSDRVLVAREAPIRKLEEIRVPISRPRSYEAALDPSFVSAKKEIIRLLREPAATPSSTPTQAPGKGGGDL